MRQKALLIAVVCLLYGPGPVQPQPGSDVQQCVQARSNPDRAIGQCTLIIESDRFSGPNLAVAYNNRGVAWIGKGDLDRAIADFDFAIRLNPNAADSYTNRGLAWMRKGDYERAVADYGAALRLNADDRLALRNRGLARFFQGRFALASQDLVRTLELGSEPDAYGLIWRYLAQARGGVAAPSALAEDRRRLPPDAWPAPVISLFLGEIGPEAVIAAAAHADAEVMSERRCERDYYLGQWDLLRNKPGQAAARFRAAEKSCPKSFMEYSGAIAELERLR